MSRNWKGFASIGAGMAALTLAAPALAAPADLDFDVDLGGHSWYVSNDDGLDDGTPPECDGSAGLAINDAETPAESDAFDVAYLLTVAGEIYADDDGTVDRSTEGGDEVVTADPTEMGGLEVSAQYRFFAEGDVVRELVTLTNPGAAAITTPVAIQHNWGSDDWTQVYATESGDAAVQASDRWVITTESDPEFPDEPSGDPINTSVFYGPGTVAAAPTAITEDSFDCAGTEGLAASFEVEVPAGATRHLVFFGRISDPDQSGNEEAVTNLGRVFGPMSTTSPLWAGIPAEAQANVLNWAPQGEEPTPTTTTTSTTAPSTTSTTSSTPASPGGTATPARPISARPAYTG